MQVLLLLLPFGQCVGRSAFARLLCAGHPHICHCVAALQVLAGLLRVGGVWVNLGPLLYHFADAFTADGREEMSVEVSLEDVKRVAVAHGFELEREDMVQAMYTANPQSMMHTEYTCALWTMVKRR